MVIKSKYKVLPQGVIVKFNTDRNLRFLSDNKELARKVFIKTIHYDRFLPKLAQTDKIDCITGKINDFDLSFHC